MTRLRAMPPAVLVAFAAFALNVVPPGDPLLASGALIVALVYVEGRRRDALPAAVVLTATVCLLVAATPLPTVAVNQITERCAAGPADAIVVLEGDTGQDRIIHGLRMFQQGWAPVLIVTGTSSLDEGWRYFDTATLFGLRERELRRVEVRRGGTYGEALALHEDPVGQRLRRLLLVTSPAHSARAARVFRKFAYDVCSVPLLLRRRGPDAWGRTVLARELFREVAAWAYYAVRGWV